MSNIANFRTTLKDGRVLYGDGDSVVTLPFLYNHILNGGDVDGIFVSKEDVLTDEVAFYNRKFPNETLSNKDGVAEIPLDWVIPEEYKTLGLHKYIVEEFKKEIDKKRLTDEEIDVRYYRIKLELRLWNERNLDNMLRALIYIVNTFRENNIVWGTGRGSSCASYILYLIGLHHVDSVKYNVDIGEFFR